MPVTADGTYRATVTALQPRNDRGVADLEFDVLNQDRHVCATGVIKLLLNRRQAAAAASV